MQQVISSRGVITWSVLHGGGGNNVCHITWGCNMNFSKWLPKILHEFEYLVFHNFFFFAKKIWIFLKFLIFLNFFLYLMKFLKFYENFGEKKVFFRNSRFPVRLVFVIKVSLFTSVVCYYQMDYEENMENAHYATND